MNLNPFQQAMLVLSALCVCFLLSYVVRATSVTKTDVKGLVSDIGEIRNDVAALAVAATLADAVTLADTATAVTP